MQKTNKQKKPVKSNYPIASPNSIHYSRSVYLCVPLYRIFFYIKYIFLLQSEAKAVLMSIDPERREESFSHTHRS